MDTRLKSLYEASYAGDVDYLKKLLEEDKLLLDRVVATTDVNDNPLHIAAYLGHAAFAREILCRKPKLAREFNAQRMSPVHLAAAHGHLKVLEELLQVDPDLCLLQESKDGYLPVHIAVIKGRHDLFTLLIEKCEHSLNVLTYRSEAVLHLATNANCLEIIEHLTTLGVTQLTLNAEDGNRNTSLHLAFAGRQQQVIKHLLSHKDIDVNPVNSAGRTPLDVLLVTNHEMGDLYLGEMIRGAGGKTAKELGISESNLTDSASVNDRKTLLATNLSTSNNRVKKTKKKRNELPENNLIVVATLVATVTFAAALNPPGGPIPIPYAESDRNNSTWLTNWENMNSTYPAGNPVYLWELRNFFKYDYLALLASITVILFCLLGVARRSITMMKLLRLGVWSSILFMVLAFNSALSVLIYKDRNFKKFRWYTKYFKIWIAGFSITAGTLVTAFVSSLIDNVFLIAKRLAPGWISNPFGSRWKKTKTILYVIFSVAIAYFVGRRVSVAINEMATSSTS